MNKGKEKGFGIYNIVTNCAVQLITINKCNCVINYNWYLFDNSSL